MNFFNEISKADNFPYPVWDSNKIVKEAIKKQGHETTVNNVVIDIDITFHTLLEVVNVILATQQKILKKLEHIEKRLQEW